jgi:SMP-30/gluconolaconase/LRE-like protein
MRKVVPGSLAICLFLGGLIVFTSIERSTVHAQQAAPAIRKVRPDVITTDSPAFTLRVEGKRFDEGATIVLDGTALQTTVSTSKVVLAEIPASFVANVADHNVRVMNSDGALTDSLTLSVVAALPDFMFRLEDTAVQEDSAPITPPTMRSEGFDADVKVFVWGKSVNFAISADGTRLQFLFPDGFVDDPARVPITLRDKKGRYSNTEIFTIVPKPPRLGSIDPDNVNVGDGDFLLKVFGAFKDTAKIVVNDVVLDTVVKKDESRLEATVPASFSDAPSQLVVRVLQDGLESEDNILTVTPTDDPFVYTIAPNRIRVGEPKISIDLIGSNFDGKTTAFIDGQEATIKEQTRKRLKVSIDQTLLATPGHHTVFVQSKDGVSTDPIAFEVAPDVSVTTLVGQRFDGFNKLQCVSAADAMLRRPRRVMLGADGLLYMTDQQNHAIRTVNPATGEVCTIAGTGLEGYHDSGNSAGEPPTFSFPNGLVVLGNTIYVTENGNAVVRRIVRNGDTVTVDTFAGTANEIADKSRQNRLNSTLFGIEGFRDSTLRDSEFRLPDDIVAAHDGTLYIADAGNHAIRRISPGSGVVETIAGNGVPGFADGVVADARFNTPTALALSADERFLFVADTLNVRIRKIDLLNGVVTSYAGSGETGVDDGPAHDATFTQPIGLALDKDGVLYVSELGLNDIRRVDTEGNVSTLAGGGDSKFRDGTGVDARFDTPKGMAIDTAHGILYVVDQENFRIRKIVLR